MYIFAVPSLCIASLALLMQSELDMEIQEAGIVAIVSAVAGGACIIIAHQTGLV
jgi:hypothetical protein